MHPYMAWPSSYRFVMSPDFTSRHFDEYNREVITKVRTIESPFDNAFALCILHSTYVSVQLTVLTPLSAEVISCIK